MVFDAIITRSRLSTSTLKPEIMGTSMTAMLDEPEWSHLDRELRLELIRIRLVCVYVYVGVCWGLYLAQISNEMWKSSLSWWPAGSSSSMGARRFRLRFSSERLSARLRERGGRCREEDEDKSCVCRSWTGSFRFTLS